MIVLDYECNHPEEGDPSFFWFSEYNTKNIIEFKYTHGMITISRNNIEIYTLKNSEYLESMIDLTDLIDATKHIIDWSNVRN
jgi:hypothetical protein